VERIRTRAGQVAVEVRGEGTPVVLLHSVAHDHHDWDAIVPTLARSFLTIAVDWPGHGRSDMFDPPEAASAERLFDTLEDVVRAMDLPPAVFVGNSIGGTASLRLALREPSRVRGLVMIDSAGLEPPTAFTRAACWLQGREVVRRWTGMAFARHYLHARNERVDALLERLRLARARPGFIEMDPAMWRDFPARFLGPGRESAASACPTLLVWGKHDPVLSAKVAGRRAREVLRHARYVELDTGHTPFVEDPAAFLDVLEPFLRSLDAPLSAPRGAVVAAGTGVPG